MKNPHKNKEKKDKVTKKLIMKSKNDQVLIVAQEIKFARLLSGNEKKSRDKVLKTLKKWLLSGFEKKDVGPHSNCTMLKCKEEDFVRIWKGLFYGVWLSDKPLVQEELCENIAGILDLFPQEYVEHALLMYRAGLRVLASQWYGIDHHRMDKFLMLVRRCLRASLRCLLRTNWRLSTCQLYNDMIAGSDGILAVTTPRYARNATSMILHFLDCYLEEIAKVSSGAIPPAALAELLRPVCEYLYSGEQPILATASRRVLTTLLRQSEPGLRYQHAATAWQRMGCPEGGPEALELIPDDEEIDDTEKNGFEEDDDDSEVKALDPRAGRVNVDLPCLPVPAELLADMLRGLLVTASGKAHKRLRLCMQRFKQLALDEYPLRVNVPSGADSPTRGIRPGEAAHSLQVLEKTLVTDSDELALRGLSRKHRKRLLAKSRAGSSILEDVESVRQKITNATMGEWQVESTEPERKKTKHEESKENKKRKANSKDEREHKRRRADKFNDEVAVEDKKDANKVDKMNSSKTIAKFTNHTEKVSDKLNKHKEINKNNKQEINKTIASKDTLTKKFNKIDVIKQNGFMRRNENVKGERAMKEQGEMITVSNKHKDKSKTNNNKTESKKNVINPYHLVNKVKHFHKQSVKTGLSSKSMDTPKKVKFVLKNNSMQAPIDYYKSIRQSPNIPFDGTKKPTKTNLKPSTPSPINPFLKKKLKLKC